MVSAFSDMDAAAPHFISSAASQKAKFSPENNHKSVMSSHLKAQIHIPEISIRVATHR